MARKFAIPADGVVLAPGIAPKPVGGEDKTVTSGCLAPKGLEQFQRIIRTMAGIAGINNLRVQVMPAQGLFQMIAKGLVIVHPQAVGEGIAQQEDANFLGLLGTILPTAPEAQGIVAVSKIVNPGGSVSQPF